jgi:hypothetical protein
LLLGAILLSYLVSEQQKLSSPGIEPKTAFGLTVFVSATSSWKQTTLVLAPFFYHAYFLNYSINLCRESNSGQSFSGLWSSFLQYSLRDKQLWFWRRSSVMHSFQAAGIALARNRTQVTFPEF